MSAPYKCTPYFVYERLTFDAGEEVNDDTQSLGFQEVRFAPRRSRLVAEQSEGTENDVSRSVGFQEVQFGIPRSRLVTDERIKIVENDVPRSVGLQEVRFAPTRSRLVTGQGNEAIPSTSRQGRSNSEVSSSAQSEKRPTVFEAPPVGPAPIPTPRSNKKSDNMKLEQQKHELDEWNLKCLEMMEKAEAAYKNTSEIMDQVERDMILEEGILKDKYGEDWSFYSNKYKFPPNRLQLFPSHDD